MKLFELKNEEERITFDMYIKAICLLFIMYYIYMIIDNFLQTREVLNLPDFIVIIIQSVIFYFFRKSPIRKDKSDDG